MSETPELSNDPRLATETTVQVEPPEPVVSVQVLDHDSGVMISVTPPPFQVASTEIIVRADVFPALLALMRAQVGDIGPSLIPEVDEANEVAADPALFGDWQQFVTEVVSLATAADSFFRGKGVDLVDAPIRNVSVQVSGLWNGEMTVQYSAEDSR